MTTETTPVHDDPDSPAARARREAEAAWQEVYGQDHNAPPADPPPAPAPAEPPPAEPPPVEPAPRTELHLRQTETRPAEPRREEVVEEDPLAALKAEHAAELRRAYDTIAGMRGNIDQLRGQVDILARQRQPEPEPKREEPPAPRLITPDEEKAYGPDLLDVIARRSQEVYEPVVDKLVRRIDALENQLAGMGRHVVQSAQMTLGQVLSRDVGEDWAQQNLDPEFLSWLQREDPISGLQRQQLLITARDSGNATRVANLFKAYRTETGRYSGQSGTANPPATAITRTSDGGQPAPAGTGPGRGKVPLTALIAPGRSRTAVPSAADPGEVPFMSEDEINEHYRLRTLKRVSKEDQKAFDVRLAAAMAAGKVEVRPKV
jgi:hypothetical protein